MLCETSGVAALVFEKAGRSDGTEPGETVVICNITKRVMRSTILQHSRVKGFADPVVECIMDAKKVPGCAHPRKRIWEELESQAGPEAKRLCVTKRDQPPA